MVLDVLDLPASLKQWDSFEPCNEGMFIMDDLDCSKMANSYPIFRIYTSGMLTVPSYEDLNSMKVKYSIFPLDNEDEVSDHSNR